MFEERVRKETVRRNTSLTLRTFGVALSLAIGAVFSETYVFVFAGVLVVSATFAWVVDYLEYKNIV